MRRKGNFLNMYAYLIITRGNGYGYAYIVHADHGNRARSLVIEQAGSTEKIVDSIRVAADLGAQEGISVVVETFRSLVTSKE